MHSELVEVPLGPGNVIAGLDDPRAQAPPSRLSGMLNVLTMTTPKMHELPRLLPVLLYSLFCVRVRGPERGPRDVESAAISSSASAAGPAHARPTAPNSSIFLVPRLPDSTLFVSRPAVERASSRFYSWIKHSIFRVPRRKAPILG
jgi:hypothetical protein